MCSIGDTPYFQVSGNNIQAILTIKTTTRDYQQRISSQDTEFVITLNKDSDQDEKNYHQIFKNDHGIQGEFLQTFLPLLFKAQLQKDLSILRVNDYTVGIVYQEKSHQQLLTIKLQYLRKSRLKSSDTTKDINIMNHYLFKKGEGFLANTDILFLNHVGWNSLLEDINDKVVIDGEGWRQKARRV